MKEPSFEALLREAGCVIHNRRGDCPDCGGHYTVSINFQKEKFQCWRDRDGELCGFRGGTEVLKQRLGLSVKLPPEEYRRKLKDRKLQEALSDQLHMKNRDVRLHVGNKLLSINRLEMKAHNRGPSPLSWNQLEHVYRVKPKVERALERLEESPNAEYRRRQRIEL